MKNEPSELPHPLLDATLELAAALSKSERDAEILRSIKTSAHAPRSLPANL